MTPPPPPALSPLKTFLERLPLLQFAAAMIISICAAWTTMQLASLTMSNEIQRVAAELSQTKTNIRDLKEARDKQIDIILRDQVTKQNLQDKFETMMKLQELTREDVKNLRDSIERDRVR